MMEWKKMISQRVGQEQLADITSFVLNEEQDNRSSLDKFYGESRSILRNTPVELAAVDWVGAANAVAIISVTENYFRSILSEILKVCMVSRRHASENTINFGSVLWHPAELIQRGAFEHISFSDSKKIIEITKKYIGVDASAMGLVPILNEFSKVCELRHGIVHSGRYLAGKNALILNFPSSKHLVKIGIGYGQLQSIAAICTTLVVSYNQKMFEILCQRWATTWRHSTFWKPELENELIKHIWGMFYSVVDENDGLIEDKGTWVKCRNLLRLEYNL